MPSLTDLQKTRSPKILLLGDSGSGKTGALCALADAGYSLYVLDFDNGYESLAFSRHPERIFIEPCDDNVRMVNNRFICDTQNRQPVAFRHAMQCLDEWPGVGKGVNDFTPNDVLVIDSLSFMSDAVMRWTLFEGSSFGGVSKGPFDVPSIPAYAEAMRRIEATLHALYSSSLVCGVVVTAHVTRQDEDEGARGYPLVIGKKLSPKIPRYFNTVVLAQSRGGGENSRRFILTRATRNIELKVPADVPYELPQETGLATLFKAIRGSTPPTQGDEE